MEEKQVAQVTQKWSILLLYPFAHDSDIETYYAHVEAPTAIEGIQAAKKEMIDMNGWNLPEVVELDGPFDDERIEVLLVLEGHHNEYPWRAE